MQGVWVKSNYLNSISKTESPYKSFKELRGVASMTIAVEHIKNDSISIGYSLNNHEGGNFTIYFIAGQKLTLLKTNLSGYDGNNSFYELGCCVKGVDTSLILYHYNKNNRIIDSIFYTRVANKATDESDAGWGIDYITNKKLATGSYEGVDSAGVSVKIEFKDNGKVYGFYNSKNYYISTDFEAGPANNLDQIGFYESDLMKAKWYSFKFNKDTLNLYNTYHNADSTLLFVGKRMYKLVKQK